MPVYPPTTGRFAWETPFLGQSVVSVPAREWQTMLYTIFDDIDNAIAKLTVTSADTTPGHLTDKLVAGSGVTFNVLNSGANEQLEIIAAGGGGGGGVTSLNTLVGAVVLAHGTGISITPAGNTLTIAATGGSTYVLKAGDSMSGPLSVASGSSPSPAILTTVSGTGRAASFNISNAANSAALTFGNTAGTGNLIQMQKGGVDKFVVDNNGNITVGGGIGSGFVLRAGDTMTGSLNITGPASGLAVGVASGGPVNGGDHVNFWGKTSIFSRLYWNAVKSGLRAGIASGTEWNDPSFGNYSFAMGTNNIASGTDSTSLGTQNTASGNQSFAGGSNCVSSGDATFAFGSAVHATANGAISLGWNNTSSGFMSYTWGNNCQATADMCIALGVGSVAGPGVNATAMGNTTTASGAYSTAIGYQNVASGNYSTVMGLNSTASNQGTVAIGDTVIASGNVCIAMGLGISAISPMNNTNDASLGIGFRSDVPTLFVGPAANLPGSIGKVGIGTTAPGYMLEVNGSAAKPGGGSWTASSDERLKKNAETMGDALDRLLSLRGVYFEWLDPERKGASAGRKMGMIAQEVEVQFPEWIETDVEGYKGIAFSGFEALTVEAVRALRTEVEALKAEVAALKSAR